MSGSIRRILAVLALLALLVLTLCFRAGSGTSPESQALGSLDQPGNLTLQNERIAVFSGSSFWEPFPAELGKMLGREIVFFFRAATTTPGALPYCGTFGDDRFGIIIVGFGGEDRLEGLSWEQTENALREMFRRLKNTGAVVVYSQLVPDHSGAGYFPASQVCLEEDVILVPNMSMGIMDYDPATGLVFDPHFNKPGDDTHPNDEAYVVYAERTAKVLVEEGLAELTQGTDEMLLTVEALFSNTTSMIEELEQRGVDTAKIDEPCERAEYLRDSQYYYSARWELENKVTPRLETHLENWENITQLFEQAREKIDTDVRRGIDTQSMEQWYASAENSWWNRLDYGATSWNLQQVLNAEEPWALWVATLILLPPVLRRLRIQGEDAQHKDTERTAL